MMMNDIEIHEAEYHWEQLNLGIGALKEDGTMDVRDILPILNQCMKTAQAIQILEDTEIREYDKMA